MNIASQLPNLITWEPIRDMKENRQVTEWSIKLQSHALGCKNKFLKHSMQTSLFTLQLVTFHNYLILFYFKY